MMINFTLILLFYLIFIFSSGKLLFNDTFCNFVDYRQMFLLPNYLLTKWFLVLDLKFLNRNPVLFSAFYRYFLYKLYYF